MCPSPEGPPPPSPDEVAEAMLDCVESESLVGGTILEVGAGQTRIVPPFNNPGPNETVRKLDKAEVGIVEAPVVPTRAISR